MKLAKTSDIVNQSVTFLSQNISYKKDFFGDAPAPFIGRYGYPHVHVGVLSAEVGQEKALLDSPKEWRKRGTSLRDIVHQRSALVNSRFQSSVTPNQDRLQQLAGEVGLAAKPVEVELHLKKAPQFHLQTSHFAAPHGPRADLVKGKTTSNARIPLAIQKAHDDTALKASDALSLLYKKGFDEHYLSKVLSVGAFGEQKNRKLVPTRWSITATDDTIGKDLLEKVRLLSELDEYLLFSESYLGNYYFILFLPGCFSYELFETATLSPEMYSTDHEGFKGRKNYAENTAGGYYTVRLAVLEKMLALKKQGMAVVFRYITPDYEAPLGVWVTREAARKALESQREEPSREALLLALKTSVGTLGQDVSYFLKKSKLLEQKSLFDF